MSLMHLFMNNPTEGGTDGTEISSGTETLPLTFTLDAAQSESAIAKCAVRCDSGYEVSGDTTIEFVGSDTSKWQLALDENFADTDVALSMANWQSQIAISDVGATNSVFWVKATSAANELPQNDRSVDIRASGLVIAVGD